MAAEDIAQSSPNTGATQFFDYFTAGTDAAGMKRQSPRTCLPGGFRANPHWAAIHAGDERLAHHVLVGLYTVLAAGGG